MSFNPDSVYVNAGKLFHISENPIQWGGEAEGNKTILFIDGMIVLIKTHKNLQITKVNVRLLDMSKQLNFCIQRRNDIKWKISMLSSTKALNTNKFIGKCSKIFTLKKKTLLIEVYKVSLKAR